jgi:hypothetical protein
VAASQVRNPIATPVPRNDGKAVVLKRIRTLVSAVAWPLMMLPLRGNVQHG